FNHRWTRMNTDCAMEPGKAVEGHRIQNLAECGAARQTRSVLECAGPLALWNAAIANPNSPVTFISPTNDLPGAQPSRFVYPSTNRSLFFRTATTNLPPM